MIVVLVFQQGMIMVYFWDSVSFCRWRMIIVEDEVRVEVEVEIGVYGLLLNNGQVCRLGRIDDGII